MLCQCCGKKEATTHIKQIINGELKEGHYCTECAMKQGYGDMFNMNFSMGNLLGSFFGLPTPSSTIETRCPLCGTTFSEITKTGNVGCGKCYEVFGDRLMPSIQKIHGNTKHIGKVPKTASKKAQMKSKLETVRENLQKAIENQEFEKAAKYRDEIKVLESQVKDDE